MRGCRQSGQVQQNEMYYYIAFVMTGLLLLGGSMLYKFQLKNYMALPECMIYRMTGIYCPACGGTRAVLSLLEGKIAESLWYHPAVLYSVCLWSIYVLINTCALVFTRSRDKMVHFGKKYIIIGLLLFAVNFILKNV